MKIHLKDKHILLVIRSMTRCFPKLHIVHVWRYNLPKKSTIKCKLFKINRMMNQLEIDYQPLGILFLYIDFL